MSKWAGSRKGDALGIGCTVALVAGMLSFLYWVTHGDLITIGVVLALSLIAGGYSLSRRRLPPSSPTTGDRSSSLDEPTLDRTAVSERASEARVGKPVAASPSVARLASLLTMEKGYKPVKPREPAFGFVARRRHWGSHAWIALVGADALDDGRMLHFAERFFDLVWNDVSLIGMGAYGILCFVFEEPPSAPTIEYIRGLKRAPNPGKGNWMVYWTIDVSTGRVFPHAGPPWGLYPGRAYLEKAIRI